MNTARGRNPSLNSGRRKGHGSLRRHRSRQFRRSPSLPLRIPSSRIKMTIGNSRSEPGSGSRPRTSHGINRAPVVRSSRTCAIRIASIRKTSTGTARDSPSINNTSGKAVTIVIDGIMNRPGYHQDNGRDHHNDWQGNRARDWRSDHRTWEQRGGYHGYRIPELRIGRFFGPGHFFRIHDLPVMVLGGYPRFLYRGYWFSLVDPWPEYWADDWYETDDVYIVDGGDGYYLFNRRYPGEGIAVSVSM